jgi:hypothetical protein
MKKYYKVAHAGVVSIPKSKELNSDSLDELLDNFINWKYEESWFTDLNIDKLYFHNENLNIDKLYFKDEDVDNIQTEYEEKFSKLGPIYKIEIKFYN